MVEIKSMPIKPIGWKKFKESINLIPRNYLFPLKWTWNFVCWILSWLCWLFSWLDWGLSWLVYRVTNLGIFKIAVIVVTGFTLWHFWCEFTDRNEDRIQRAWNIVYSSTSKGGDGMKNALEFLNQKGQHFDNLDLTGAILDGIHLEKAHLYNTILTDCSFKDAHLEGADLKKSYF